ncbi:uncharacterized protein BKA78DRAFT_307219 [Phyllosticta capitalensis]|uniref:uncharacterized protein n=1 Tax=Phyllosticta capitalensis TaxID=121624 RepID=UPI00312F071E
MTVRSARTSNVFQTPCHKSPHLPPHHLQFQRNTPLLQGAQAGQKSVVNLDG